jgi:hypothetical protein
MQIKLNIKGQAQTANEKGNYSCLKCYYNAERKRWRKRELEGNKVTCAHVLYRQVLQDFLEARECVAINEKR